MPDLGQRSSEGRPREVRSSESVRPEAAEGRKEPPPVVTEFPSERIRRDPPPRDASIRRSAPAAFAAAAEPEFLVPDFVDQPEVEKKPVLRAAPPPPKAPQDEPKPADLAAFRAIVDKLNERRAELAAFLAHAAILEFTPGEMKLGFEPGDMFSKRFDDKESQEILKATATEHFGAPTKVTFEFESARAKTIKTLATIESEALQQRQREAIAQAKKHRGITDAVEVLGARLKDLKLPILN